MTCYRQSVTLKPFSDLGEGFSISRLPCLGSAHVRLRGKSHANNPSKKAPGEQGRKAALARWAKAKRKPKV
jgi:hypothetical protein